ncbi:Hpt domain-containing protein [Stigmatella sp. ncwal1]|uniref:Hpt domain-containing protein n=1 Tax=Stigmatella ashevillensis TaxID=2995309 RepID=A0ABT5D7J2_9BACT|nr:Hpt domain-containing protein [Stigmatella ashevillena]MDC0709029.1 Hpt domain-containing protein [Stigmatella ashevillena]
MGTKDDEVLQEFLQESRENLAPFEAGLLRLETEPPSAQLLMDLYRYIHNVKGACGFLRFGGLETLARAGEDLVELARQKKLALEPSHRSALASLAQALREGLDRIEATRSEGVVDHGELLLRLRRLHPEPQGRS